MEEIGIRLRNAREARKLTIKEIAKETNISPIYLEALENEEFDRLPGETYVLGFLRTYAESLKIDPDEITQYYKGYKIGESTTPLEELTKPTGPLFLASLSSLYNQHKNIFHISGIAIALILFIWGLISIFSSDIDIEDRDSIKDLKKEYADNKKSNEAESIRHLQLADDKGYILIYKNEAAQFLVENKEVMFVLKDIKANSVVVEFVPGNQFETIEIEKPHVLDLKGCPREIVLTLKGLTDARAKIFVMLGGKTGTAAEEVRTSSDTAESTVIAQSSKNLKIVFEAEFTSKTYLELYLDGMQKKKGIFPAGSRERWEASEYIQLKIGNAGGLNSKINGKVYSFGLPGQVANKVITWKKDEKNPNLYRIVVKDW